MAFPYSNIKHVVIIKAIERFQLTASEEVSATFQSNEHDKFVHDESNDQIKAIARQEKKDKDENLPVEKEKNTSEVNIWKSSKVVDLFCKQSYVN